MYNIETRDFFHKLMQGMTADGQQHVEQTVNKWLNNAISVKTLQRWKLGHYSDVFGCHDETKEHEAQSIRNTQAQAIRDIMEKSGHKYMQFTGVESKTSA